MHLPCLSFAATVWGFQLAGGVTLCRMWDGLRNASTAGNYSATSKVLFAQGRRPRQFSLETPLLVGPPLRIGRLLSVARRQESRVPVGTAGRADFDRFRSSPSRSL
jgi:hypothetical protein